MAEPTEDYLWAESAAVDRAVDPGASLRASGWPVNSPLVSSNANFMFRAIGRWIDWLEQLATGEVGRNPTDGYSYSSDYEVAWNLTPTDGGYRDMTANLAVIIETSPAHIRPTSTGAGTIVRIPLKWYINTEVGDDPMFEITNFYARVKGTVDSTILISLDRAPYSAAGASAVVRSWAPTLSGTFTDRNDAGLSIALDPAYQYWVNITIGDTVAVADVGLQALVFTVNKSRVE